MKKLFRARILNPLGPNRLQAFADGGLLVENGKVSAIGEFAELQKNAQAVRVFDLKHRVLIPGLIDTHVHLPQLDQRGKYGTTLLEWLQRYIFAAEARFSDLHVAEEVGRRFFKKLILNGTTTAAIYTTIHAAATNLAFEQAKAAGVRVIMGKVMMDQNSPRSLLENTRNSIDESVKLCERWDGVAGGRLRYAFTPRFAPTCSEELWRAVGNLIEQSGAYMQTHIAETLPENAAVKKMFPRYKDYLSLFEKTGCLREKTIYAHAIHMNFSQYKRMARANACIAHCPHSNLFLKSGRMPVELVEKAGVRYGYGTDVGAGPSMSMFAVMRHADYVQTEESISPKKAFYLATLGGARALHMENQIGNFVRGKWADFVVLDTHGIDPVYDMMNLSNDELLSLLMYRGDGQAVEATYVAGEKLDVDGF